MLNTHSQRTGRKDVEENSLDPLQHFLNQEDVTIYSHFRSKREVFERAVEDFDVILAKSFVISADMQDIQMGRDLNCKTIFLKTRTEEKKAISYLVGPHFIAHNVQEAVAFVT